MWTVSGSNLGQILPHIWTPHLVIQVQLPTGAIINYHCGGLQISCKVLIGNL